MKFRSQIVYRLLCFLKGLQPVFVIRQMLRKRRLVQAAEKRAAAAFGFRADWSDEEKRARIADVGEMARKYGFSFKEYMLFEFPDRPEPERARFVSDWEHAAICQRLNRPRNRAVFNHKALTYARFQPFYHRTVFFVPKTAQMETEVRRFASLHDSFVMKPAVSAGGSGVRYVVCADEAALTKAIAAAERMPWGVVLEEPIRQHPALAALNPTSVNTVRIAAVRMRDDQIAFFPPALRVGRKGSRVDNAGAGGIICVADVQTGVVTAARDERGGCFTAHPDSEAPLIGFPIPRWDEALQLVRTLAQVVPSNRYTGWDLALTESGWVLVEANASGQFIWQYANQTGSREQVEQIFEKIRQSD